MIVSLTAIASVLRRGISDVREPGSAALPIAGKAGGRFWRGK